MLELKGKNQGSNNKNTHNVAVEGSDSFIKRFLTEIGRYLLILGTLFTVTVLIVMGPTLWTKASFYFLDNQSQQTQTSQQISQLPEVRERNESIELTTSSEIPEEDMIVIPKINVRAPLVYPNSASNDAILEAVKSGVAHYPGTALPGQVGNSFLTAHSSYYWWSGGKYNSIFANLDQLSQGDEITIYYNEEEYVYRVDNTKVVQPTNTDVLNATENPTVTLMSCWPVGTNLRRLIVTGELTASTAEPGQGSGTASDAPQVLPLN